MFGLHSAFFFMHRKKKNERFVLQCVQPQQMTGRPGGVRKEMISQETGQQHGAQSRSLRHSTRTAQISKWAVADLAAALAAPPAALLASIFRLFR